jgi:hypothetical protein
VSTPAAAADAPSPPKSSGGGGKLGIWGKKYGPLPLWGWAAILLVFGLLFLYIKNKNSAASTSTSADAGSTTAADSTGAGQVPQFVNQTYTTVSPPAAPAAPVSTSTVSNQIPGHHVITANGSETLAQIASKNGTTAADIIAFTKAHKPHQSAVEAKFFSKPTGKVPKGIVLWVPEKQVTNITGPGPGGAGSS